jgi:hypothetical protein
MLKLKIQALIRFNCSGSGCACSDHNLSMLGRTSLLIYKGISLMIGCEPLIGASSNASKGTFPS